MSQFIPRRIVIALPLLLAVAVLCVAAALANGVRAGGATTVTMVDNEFQPASITINVGDTITWVNDGALPHTATADDGTFDSGQLATGEQFSFTFETAGTFAYHCENHGGAGGQGMAGEVIVQDAAPAPTATPAATAPAGGATPTETPSMGMPASDAPSATEVPSTSVLDRWNGSTLALAAAAALVIGSVGGLLVMRVRRMPGQR